MEPLSNPDPDPIPTPSLPRDGLTLSPGQWTRDQARKIVKSDFDSAARWRQTNIEPKWVEAMDTYLAVREGVSYWKGTRIPRANLQSFQAFQQINALRPSILDALTGTDLAFDVEGKAGVTFTQSLQVRTLVEYFLQNLGRDKRLSLRMALDKLTEDGMVLGNGVWEVGWEQQEKVTQKWEMHPEMSPHPFVSGAMAPTGRVVPAQMPQSETQNQFYLDPVEQVDFYIDPFCRTTDPNDGEFCVRRKMMSIEQLGAYRGMEGFDVPEDNILYALSRVRTSSQGDSTFSQMQSSQGVNSEPLSLDGSRDPRQARVEVIRYWQKTHYVWLLGGRHVMFNGENPYGMLPFVNWCYVNKPGSFYGWSIPELLRGDQALIRTLMNGRVDELALILHPPFITKRGTFATQSQRTFAPGANWEADDPKGDVQRIEMGNITMNASEEIAAAENRGQKKTGVTDLAVIGTPSTGGNSANRTATGVQAQTNASNSRTHGLVANLEDTCMHSMLDFCWKFMGMYLSPEDAAKILGEPMAIQFAMDTLNSDPRFVMKTANAMKMRAAMQNGGITTLTQYITNPEMLSQLAAQQGIVLDMGQFLSFYLDIYGVKVKSFFRPETPQETQARQQSTAQAGQEKMALQSARLGAMSADAQQRDETQIMVALINALAQAGVIGNVSGIEGPVQLEARRLDAELQNGNGAGAKPDANGDANGN